MDRELHSPAGCVLPVQIDVYALGVMFYYLLTSHSTLLPEEMTPRSITEGLSSMATGYGTTTAQSGACLPGTYARVAGIVQRMVAKNYKDRFLSMIQVRKELSLIRDQEREAQNEAEMKMSSAGQSDQKQSGPTSIRPVQTVPTPSSSYTSSTLLPRSSSPANSMHSLKSTSTLASQELDAHSLTARCSTSSTHTPENLSYEDRAFVLESVLSLSHITNLQEMLRAISHALDNILVGHPPEEMAIILWQKDEHLPNGGTWAIMEDKFRPGTTQATLTWTDLSERRDHMPVLVRKALDTQEPIFSTAVGSRSQLPTIACVPILKASAQSSGGGGGSSNGGVTVLPTLVGVLYLHHLHPRFYFTKRDQDLVMMFCQKLASPLLHCEKIAGVEKQLSLATQRNRFLEDTIARIQKNEHEVFSWMEALPCFVWVAERDDVASRRYLSRSWFDFTGLPRDTRTSDRWISAMHPDDVAAHQKEASQSYKTGVYKDCEFRLMRYDGVYRWHLSRAVAVLNHSGAILKWVGVTIDIDDLYLAQKAELHKKSNFLANMSHELRTPFSGFHGMLTLLGFSDLDEEQKEFVYTAKASCEKLLLIIDDLLDFSKLEADKVILEASPFDLEEVFDEVEDIVQPLAFEKSLELAFIKEDDVPEVLIGDCNRLKQILLNLVGNAIKFTHSGHVIVRCKVLDKEADMSTISSDSSTGIGEIDDDKFYFRHEKNGGGQCQSEMRPPNSGRFSSPEPLSENSIRLTFSVEDTGIGIGPDEQEVLFSPFSQVDGSATRSYGGSGLGLSICLQLVKLMKGRIGLVSKRDKGSTFWFVIQCEQSITIESPERATAEADVVDSTKEIKRITRTLGTPRILIASISETTISTLQAYLSDFNTEVANLPLTASSRLEESVSNGIRFDFVCWDFPMHDPQHTTMLELQARSNLNNVHFVLLYTPSTDIIRRAQSLQLPSSYSSSSSGSPLGGGARKRPMLSQSASLRLDHSGSNIGGHSSAAVSMGRSEVPGLSPEKLNSLRITCISKPIRRLKLLRAFVEILDDSAKIRGAHAIKKGGSGSSISATTIQSCNSNSNSIVSNTANNNTSTIAPGGCPLSPAATTVAPSASTSPTHSTGSPAFVSPIGMSPGTSSAFLVSTLEGAVLVRESSSSSSSSNMQEYSSSHGWSEFPNVDSATHLLALPQEQKSINQSREDAGLSALKPALDIPSPDARAATTAVAAAEDVHVYKTGFESKEQGAEEATRSVVVERSMTAIAPGGVVQDVIPLSESPVPVMMVTPELDEKKESAVSLVQDQIVKNKDIEKKKQTVQDDAQGRTTFKKKSLSNSTARNGKLRSNSPKPAKASKLVTDEATEISLSTEEAKRIEGIRILLAEDNLIAQKVLSKQLAMFGLVISCANDGADALALFKAHPRGYFTMGFFDHHMPNCDGVRATQQIRALEKEHAAEIKGPVPRLPIVAVSADIQETARKACLNSGMERYVTKPLMQKDLVAMVRHYCVVGDAEANTQPYDPPPEGAVVSTSSGSMGDVTVTTTVEAMVSAGHVSAPIGPNNCGLGPQPLLLSSSPMLGCDDRGCGSVAAGGGDERTQSQKTSTLKRGLELSPAALRGLALIRENTMQDESSKVGGGGTTTMATSSASVNSGSHPMQFSNSTSHLGGLRSRGSQTHLKSESRSIGKSSSTSSLSASYHGQGLGSSSPMIITSTPLSGGTTNNISTASSHMPGPIAAMAAGAAAAVAVASAAVNTVSSAINEHIIHQPSIYAAQGLSSPSYATNSNNGSNVGVFCPLKSMLTSGSTDSQNQSQSQQQQQQQQQQQIHHVQYLQLQQQFQQQQHQQQQPQQQQLHLDEAFVSYMHPCDPLPAVGQDHAIQTNTPANGSVPKPTAATATATVASVIVTTPPVQVGSWM
ncbi:histidine kinase osmosensor [Mortierella sp. GBA30]|nr:histidine kinase osmosensor [Mortierella sp. GBA30]